jgi:acetyl-CoA carboxylase biotin carboxylase subunit
MTVSPHYDPMLSKLCVWAPTRSLALRRLSRALDEYLVTGVTTNLAFLRALAASDAVSSGHYDTTFIERELAGLLESHRGAAVDPTALASAFAVAQTREEKGSPATDAVPPWLAQHRNSLRF